MGWDGMRWSGQFGKLLCLSFLGGLLFVSPSVDIYLRILRWVSIYLPLVFFPSSVSGFWFSRAWDVGCGLWDRGSGV